MPSVHKDMRCYLLVFAFVHLVICERFYNSADWISYKLQFNKTYSPKENLQRQVIFQRNALKIQVHNKRFKAGLEHFDMELNNFVDWTDAEIHQLFNYQIVGPMDRSINLHYENAEIYEPTTETVPKQIDWVKQGAVTPVKEQKNCLVCFIFAVIGSLEGQYFRKTGELKEFSEQQLLDCMDPKQEFCETGGYFDTCFEYLNSDGVTFRTNYPYTGEQGECRAQHPQVKTKGYKIFRNNEFHLVHALAEVGPIAVALDFTFIIFGSGKTIFDTDLPCNNPNHAVLVVGYGTDENGRDYYLMKNSFGEQWGDKGYFKMARGKNLCGIMTQSVFPVL